MPSSQATAANERRSSIDSRTTHEPPKLKTPLKTPPKQATNPLQFVKVGPCSLYRTAQEQLQKVQEVKKVKPEIQDDPEDWQSNLDNWKSSRRKRQEHIIERVVEVKKLELEEHDRNRTRRSKTFSEMMEERGNRGRKISLSLAMYQEEDSNDLSDLGIGTSSGKSSISGDTHDDAHSVLSDRDSEIDKNHSDVDNTSHENGNENGTSKSNSTSTPSILDTKTNITTTMSPLKKATLNNGFHKNGPTIGNNGHHQDYDSATTATASSPEPEEYTDYNRGFVPRLSKNVTSRFNVEPKPTTDDVPTQQPVVKIDIHKRREIFEKASRESVENKNNNNNRLDLTSSMSIKERLSFLERQKNETESVKSPRHSIDSTSTGSLRERFNRDKSSIEKEVKTRDLLAEELEALKPLKERLSSLEKFTDQSTFNPMNPNVQHNGDVSAKSIKDRLISLDANRTKETEKRSCFHEQQTNNRAENSTPSERSSSPDSEYRASRGATFHQSLDSLDADASSGPDTFERVQSLEELDYQNHHRRYPASNSSAEILNDTDREDSGIHTADASCSVSQADEPIDDEHAENVKLALQQQQVIIEEKTEFRDTIETSLVETSSENYEEELVIGLQKEQIEDAPCDAVLIELGTAEKSSSSSTSDQMTEFSKFDTNTVNNYNNPVHPTCFTFSASQRPIVYQSPRVPPRRSPPENLPPKPSYLPGLIPKDEIVLVESPNSTPDSSSTNTVCSSINLSLIDAEASKNIHSSDQVSSPESSTSPKLMSPLPSPRSPSKIPTPLPRKTVVSSPTSSSASTNSSSSTSPSKLPRSILRQAQSEISNVVKSEPSSPTSPKLVDDLRRHTVVEVCEKVLVPRGQALVTPFITIEKYHDEASGNTEDSETQLKPVVEEQELEELDEEIVKDLCIDEEEEEEEEVVEEKEIKQQQQKKIEMDLESPLLVQETLKKACNLKDDDEKQQQPQQQQPAIRPTTLALERTTSICSDFLTPLSPVSKQILPLSFSSDEEIVTGLAFPLGPPTSVEPPKEKPPPPPVDLSDEENHPIEPLKRLNSTRRIKKEIRSRRSDFLGIEGFNDDDIDRDFTLTKPPDMAAILAEERRIEQLHRRSYDTDSNYEQDSSHERDSGVELGQAEDWTKQPVSPDMSQHSRQSSEPFGASVTSSEEDEITKKEREIIEVLELEEQWRYENNREINSDIGEKLAHKLRELEEEKVQLERERASQESNDNQQHRRRHQEPTAETLRMNEENLRKQEELTRQQDEAAARQQKEIEKQLIEEKLQQEEEQLRIEDCEERERRNVEIRRQEDVKKNIQENKPMSPALSSTEDEYASREVLRVERELLQLEQEELKRQRSNLAYREQKQQQLAEQLQEQWKSLQDVAQVPPTAPPRQSQTPYTKPQPPAPINYRSSMPNLQMQDSALALKRRPPPPPIPPAKPLRLVEQRQRDVTIRNSRIPSADSIPQQVEVPLRSSCSSSALTNGQQQQQHQQQQQQQQREGLHTQQMTRQTLQALSAVPRPRIVQGDQWVQRRKSDIPRGAHDYNYQHWLIQEAEQRRLNEKNQRSPARKPHNHIHCTGTSVPYTASPPRNDTKPLPDSIIQTLTQRVQNRVQEKPLSPRRRLEHSTSQEHLHSSHQHHPMQHKVHQPQNGSVETQEKMLSVSGKKKCSHCGDELGRGAAMIIESLRLFYHMECFKCCVCHVRLGDGLMGTDVRVRNHKLHCHNCYSSDDGVKFSCV